MPTRLLQGSALGAEERAAVRRELARFTGLSEAYLEQADLRVTPSRFYKELLRDRGLTIGRLDARYTGRDYDNAGEEPDNDPSFFGIDAGYTAAINQHLRETLGFRSDRSYVTIGQVGPWDWRLGGGRDNDVYMNVAPYIGRALGRIAAFGSSSARAITISPRPSSPPNMRFPGPASRASASITNITDRAT